MAGRIMLLTAGPPSNWMRLPSPTDMSSHTRQSVHRCDCPPPQMGELTKLMAAVCEFIDVVGSYKLSPEARKRADTKRQEVRHDLWKHTALLSAHLPS